MVDQVMQQQQSPQGNGNVVALSVLQIVYGGLLVLGGLFVALIGGFASAAIGKAFAEYGGESWGALGAAMFVVIGMVMIALGALPIVSGIGLMKYRNWGRIFTLVMATLAGLGALMSLFDADIVAALVPGGFCAYAWIILTRPHIIALFNRGQTQQQTIIVEAA